MIPGIAAALVTVVIVVVWVPLALHAAGNIHG